MADNKPVMFQILEELKSIRKLLQGNLPRVPDAVPDQARQHVLKILLDRRNTISVNDMNLMLGALAGDPLDFSKLEDPELNELYKHMYNTGATADIR